MTYNVDFKKYMHRGTLSVMDWPPRTLDLNVIEVVLTKNGTKDSHTCKEDLLMSQRKTRE